MCAGGEQREEQGFPLLVGQSWCAIVSDDSHLKPLEWNMRLSNRMDAYDRGLTESVLSLTAGGKLA